MLCHKPAVYRCSVCEKALCSRHTRVHTVCSSCISKNSFDYAVESVKTGDGRASIREMVRIFWGEQEQIAFDRKFVAADLPAFAAIVDGEVVGFISFAEERDTMMIVALGVLPSHQNAGVGRKLVQKVEDLARETGKEKLLVSTSNDDLPALDFYQRLGFQIYEVRPNVVAEKHGGVV